VPSGGSEREQRRLFPVDRADPLRAAAGNHNRPRTLP
jgi:hypothetical protein